jgi:nucleoid-associated protein YgaU
MTYSANIQSRSVASTAMNRPTLRQATRSVAAQPNFARRRFVTAATAITIVVITAISALSGQPATATSTAGKTDFTYVTVLAGQSLWQIASKVAPDQDPRDFIAEVVSLNGLTSAEVTPGQRIALP